MDEAGRRDEPMAGASVPASDAPANDASASDAAGEAAPAERPLIVGIGASAGGLAAYQAFFTAMPSDSGMAFVLVQHLDPDYDSVLADILSNYTAMPVTKAQDGTVAAANSVAVIPPNAILKIENGILRIAKPISTTARRSSVDTFFVSLAQDQGEDAVGIILAGYGSDGTIGIAAIKEAGGLTLSEAAFDHHAKMGMPQSAADGGFVDSVLSIEAMPAALLAHMAYRHKVAGGEVAVSENGTLEAHLMTICAVLHSRLGRDFGQYKNSTMLRRVRRRMQVLRIEDPATYVEQLRILPDEPQLLFREILIGVTRFFRDPEIFEALASTVIASMVAEGDSSTPVRVWVAGCATGEEAFSLAILFKEACLRLDSPRRVTIFATDVDDRAIAFARAGLYTDIIEADISSDRLDHHFVKEGQRYRVAKHIRDLCVFSTHDLVKDPPFSKLDLVTCRNLLIYFEAQLQQRVITTFHYGLNRGGKLWLGPSETIANGTKLFKALDKRSRIYERLDAAPEVVRPISRRRTAADNKAQASPLSELDAHATRILTQYAPAYMILDGQNEILRFSGPVARFLEPMSGGASLNLFRLLHTDLRAPTRALLKRSAEQSGPAQEQMLFKVDGRAEAVNTIAEPMIDPGGGQRNVLLAFQEVVQLAPDLAGAVARGSGAAGVPDTELLAAREKLQVVTEELETANEELQSSNEEFQSVNEELHSTVEELETSKEELQSINEELQTVNAELHNRADSLVRSNSDLVNLFDSTSVATLFLDNDFRIRRFTPAVADVFNVQEGDEGRLITDFAARIPGDALVADARAVLRDLSSIEREVASDDGKSSFLVRIRPYRSLNNVIDGVSITLVDISERKHLDKARAHLAAIVESSEDAIISHDLDGLITSWNRGAEKIYGYHASEIIGQPMSVLLAEAQVDEWPLNLARLRDGETLTNFDISRTTKDDRSIHLSLTISPICDEKGRIVGASAVARNIADRKAAEERAALLMSELDHRVKNILAVVSSVVSQTLRLGAVPDAITREIEGRIMAIARAHNLGADQGGIESSLRAIFNTEISPFLNDRNIEIAGPDVSLTSSASLTIALAVHELTTNAAKYGALSVAGGHLAINWVVELDDGKPQLRIVWQESGGPPVAPPKRRGFGTRLIELSLVRGLHATVERTFGPGGVGCSMLVPLLPEVGSLVRRAEPET
jgi:two-component system CheB/CheR fusion protein